MLSSRLQIGLIAGFLIAMGLGLTLYRSATLNLPLLPGEYHEVWTIESKINFKPAKEPVPIEVELKLPQPVAGWAIIEQHFASSGFGFSVVEREGSDRAHWSRQSLDRPTTLYYKMQVYRPTVDALPKMPVSNVRKPLLGPDQQVAMNRLVAEFEAQSSGPERFTSLMIQAFNREQPDQDSEFLLGSFEVNSEAVMLSVLAYAGIPAHRVRGIKLEDGRRRQTLSSVLEIYNGTRWVVLDPETGEAGLPQQFFVWERGEDTILDVIGGRDSSLEFALVSNRLPAKSLVGLEQRANEYALLDFSIYSLPVEQQGVFKGLLLIPVAALVVVLMRVLIGVSTSGTFMPILIALAFIQTTLWVGLAIFVVLVGFGLWIRSWLSHMNLLLVSRVAAVIIVVILLMSIAAVISYKLGMDQVLTVTFFPTVILAWTIERMSILWEEEGGHEVFLQGGGSLLVAVLAYAAMSNQMIAHLTFNFPELTFCLLGAILLLGKYTGFRLTELHRFRNLAGS